MNKEKQREISLVLVSKYMYAGIKICQVLDQDGTNLWARYKAKEDREVSEKDIYRFLADDDVLEIPFGVEFTLYVKKSLITKFNLKSGRSEWYKGSMLAFGKSTLKGYQFYRLDSSWSSFREDWDVYNERKSAKSYFIDYIENYITQNKLIEDDEVAAWWLLFTTAN